MGYDRALLKSWAEMETWDQNLERNGAFNAYVSNEGWQHIERKYFREVKRRIELCKNLLIEHDEACVHYTLAELYDRSNLNESAELLFKRGVRFHCIKAIRKNPNYAPQWALLAAAYAWVASIGGDSRKVMTDMKVSYDGTIMIDMGINTSDPRVADRIHWLIRQAIKCVQRAISIEPGNKRYNKQLQEYCQSRGEKRARPQKNGFAG